MIGTKNDTTVNASGTPPSDTAPWLPRLARVWDRVGLMSAYAWTVPPG
jgi:hypothetical protein